MPALLWTLIIYLFLGAALLGWGTVAARFLGSRKGEHLAWAEAVWLGWSLVLLVLSLVHLLLPLAASFVIPFLASGVLFAIPPITGGLRRRPVELHISKAAVAVVLMVLLTATWIALRSFTRPPDDYDSGLYHFNAIRWTYTYPITLGLGNLHGRLAFNSSFFPFVASLDFHPFFDHGHAIANSFLLVLAIASIAHSLIPVVGHPSLLLVSHPFRYLASLFVLPPLAYLALSPGLSSPTPDVASAIIQIVLFVFLCESVARWREGYRTQDARAIIILVLAVTAVTLKLSNLGYSLGISGFVIAYWIHKSHDRLQSFFRVFLPAALIVLVWCLRGLLLSGAPLYPSTIGYVSLDWAVPRSAVVEEAYWVYSWARQPGAHWSTVLSNWAWFGPWLARRSSDFVGFVYPLELSAIMCIVAATLGIATKRLAGIVLEWAILAPTVAGLTYWFITAPDMRFANALFFLLSLTSCLLLVLSIQPAISPRAFAALLFAAIIVGNFHFFRYIAANRWILKPCAAVGTWFSCIPSPNWRPVPQAPLVTLITSSGLRVFTPATGDQCWDSPLPCTPKFSDALRTREPGVLSSGFDVTRP